MTFRLLPLLCLLLASCGEGFAPLPTEDYDALFPPKDIARPKPSETPVVRLGNAFLKPADFKYMGLEGITPRRAYTVRLTAAFTQPLGGSPSQFVVRYVNDQNQLITLSSQADANPNTTLLTAGREYLTEFTLHSGQVVYLTVNGVGDRHSSIRAQLQVSDATGLTVLPTLSTHQHQNEEGPNRIPTPFCQYYILP